MRSISNIFIALFLPHGNNAFMSGGGAYALGYLPAAGLSGSKWGRDNWKISRCVVRHIVIYCAWKKKKNALAKCCNLCSLKTVLQNKLISSHIEGIVQALSETQSQISFFFFFLTAAVKGLHFLSSFYLLQQRPNMKPSISRMFDGDFVVCKSHISDIAMVAHPYNKTS